MASLKDKRSSSRDRIVSDIRRNIASGSLKDGDKILSVRDLMSKYRVSQWIVKDALRELEKLGLVETRLKSGSYVRLANQARVPDASAKSAAIMDVELAPDYFLMPKRKTKELTVYVSDSYRSPLEFFHEAAETFMHGRPGVRIKVLTCRDGHVQDLLEVMEIDMMQTSLSIIKDIGRDSFAAVGKLEHVGIAEGDLLPVVRRHFKSAGPEPYFVPFSITLQYLYVNCNLLARSGAAKIPRSLDEMLSAVQDFERNFAADGEYGIVLNDMMTQLQIFGALSFSGGGKARLDLGKAGKLLGLLSQMRPRCMNGDVPYQEIIRQNTDSLFADGKILFYRRSSYYTQFLEEKGVRAWKAATLPAADGAPAESHLSALAVMKACKHQEEAMQFISHLTSKEMQRKYMDLHGNLPIYSEFFEGDRKPSGHPVPYEVIKDSLARSDRNWADFSGLADLQLSVNRIGEGFFSGQADADETLRLLDRALKALQ